MNWIDRALAALRQTVRDLVSEEDVPEDDRVAALLAAARVQVDALRIEMDEALAREKRAELEWRAAQTELETLTKTVDALLQAGREDIARENLVRTRTVEANVNLWRERREDYAQVAAQLRREVEKRQAQLDEMRQQVEALAGRERNVAALEQLQYLRRDLRAFATTTHSDLAEREEQIARREDRIAAREEVDKSGCR